MFKSYKELQIWTRGMDVVEKTYKITEDFPKKEMFGLTSQMRRSAVSIPINIAEGWARNSPKSFIQFLRISEGSLAELETLVRISERLNYISTEKSTILQRELDILAKMMKSLMKAIKASDQTSKQPSIQVTKQPSN